jgi:hypothetical protein
MRFRFNRLRGERGRTAYEPQTYADWREEERLIAEQEAQRRQRQAATPPNPPPADLSFQESPNATSDPHRTL